MPIRIVFFGASVTAQDVNHYTGEVTGYVTYLQKISPDFIVGRTSFPSSQYANMGIHGLTNAILQNPSIIFFEWHTTGETSICLETLSRQYMLLTHLGIKMVILVLPTLRHGEQCDLQKYSMLSLIDMPVLDLRGLISESIGENVLLRDNVHTTSIGAHAYAKCIQSYLAELVESQVFLGVNFSLFDLLGPARAYPNILSREIVLDCILRQGDGIEFSSGVGCRMIFGLIRGPFTPDVEVNYLSTSKSLVLTGIDQWSYYERSSTGIELLLSANGAMTLEVLDQLPNYEALCPKLLEPEFSSRRASNASQLEFKLEKIFVNLEATLNIRKYRSANEW
jgi:hypothetical protein